MAEAGLIVLGEDPTINGGVMDVAFRNMADSITPTFRLGFSRKFYLWL